MDAAIRAAFAVGLLLAISLGPAGAQPAGPIPRVGYLGFLGEPEASPYRDAFMRGLRDVGYVPGQSITVDVRRWTSETQLRQFLTEFARLKPDVIFVGPPFAAVAATQATKDIPIVCGSCGDPVENGLASSLARPGGSVTGIASLSAELIGKRVELLKELLPGVSRLAVFLFPANPGTPPTLRALEAAGRTLGIEMQRIEIRSAGDLDNAFRAAATGGAAAVVLQDDPLLRTVRAQIAELALKHRLPVSSGVLEVVEAGGLIAYGPDRVDMSRRASGFVDKILKGAKPAELPFEQVTKLELVVNLKTAKALGLAVPNPFLLRVDRVIE
jgi:putative tryptophan/tyrosine transport system substrate-binding protein